MPTTPPGPRWPAAVQTVAWWTRPLPFFERCRARYGHRFTTRLVGLPPFVHITDPDEIRQVFTEKPEVLHPGEGARILEPIVGGNSVILLDEDAHLEQRKLLLPAFRGDRMQRLTAIVRAVTEREIDRWPRSEPVALHGRLQGLTLEVILRAVFGLDPGPRLDRLRVLLTELITLGASPLGMFPRLQRDLGPGTSGRRFVRTRGEADRLIAELVDERRAEIGDGDSGRDDVLAMLLAARHDDGSPMTFEEIRDELMTALVAGHETTASALAWTFARLAREPRVMRELVREADHGDGDAYLTATIQESLRHRPVLPNAAPRLTMQPYELGGWAYPAGVVLSPNAYLVHHDPAVYPSPYAFHPERFIDKPPGTYTWLPFGGGRRRCLGASFAQLEMRIVLDTLRREAVVRPTGDGGAVAARRRSITVAPRDGARVVLEPRQPVARPASARAVAATA